MTPWVLTLNFKLLLTTQNVLRAFSYCSGTSPFEAVYSNFTTFRQKSDPLILLKQFTLFMLLLCQGDQCRKTASHEDIPAQLSQAKRTACKNNNSVIKQQHLVSSLHFSPPLVAQDTKPDFTPVFPAKSTGFDTEQCQGVRAIFKV